MRHWVKLWIDMLSDYVVSSLRDSEYRLFIECLLLAGEHGNGDNDGILPSIDNMAWRLRRQKDELSAMLDVLVIAGLLDKNKADGDQTQYTVTAFYKRQSPLSNAERQRLYRKRQHNEDSNKDSNEMLHPLKSKIKNNTKRKTKRNNKSTASKITKLLEGLK